MSHKESHGCPNDIVSISGRRNDKFIRKRKKRKKNHNKMWMEVLIKEE